MIDTQIDQESQSSRTELLGKTTRAFYYLTEEIGSLNSEEITPTNAPFIAGLFLARAIEMSHAELDLLDGSPESDLIRALSRHKKQRDIGEPRQILIEAKSGNFNSLKKYIQTNANTFEPEKWNRLAENLELVAERMPESGDGRLVRVPDPASMENPAPLRIQLRMLNEGKL